MKTILLIEDNDDIRDNIAEILELSSYTVITAANGKIGVEKAIAGKPDLIICDIMMPELDGYGVLHAVHRNESIRHTPFIFLTAKTERADFRKGMEAGADDYITKPFNGTELLNAVDRRLKKAELLKKELQPGLDGLQDLMEYAGDTRKVLSDFTGNRNVNKYKRKQAVYAEGNRADYLYYVTKGKIKAFKSNEDGKELVTELYSPGDFIGYTSLIEGTVYKDSAEAIEDAELAMIPKRDFEQLLNNNREIAMKFMSLLAKNVAEKEKQLLSLAYNSLRKKVAEALLLLRNKYHQSQTEEFSIDLSRENLATIAGTATESLIRTLSDFRTEKMIDIQEGRIIIKDVRKLEQLLN
ncbi:response regulator [Sediminibacterium ginsengisoli]|uniref:cAMP-binding domain of CRP or a regulatory subunit of cAMP-dependent protein kinases n=1 Tax=Sediminibacterium ginsengisoli TaxID=413434 RepID=A0A1T4LDF6_9BACT|nr:response regulator [Sediminibacterium ginsengisoli]SJZ52588.1 cAMP-binding domain of CRP or a regulatory subunit of cAMP-dependent protein kinases [Sediminibacterium ginsengisoli]